MKRLANETTADAVSPDLTSDEVAALVRARRILKAHGLPAGFTVKEVSDWGGVSRKTAYAREARERQELEVLRAEHEAVRLENEELRHGSGLKDEAIRRNERDLEALGLVKRAYEELKKSEDQENRKGKRRR